MADDHREDQPTEQTPKGLTVPVPRREDFLDNLKKVAEPDESSDDEDATTSSER
jgi:hypothetical protein